MTGLDEQTDPEAARCAEGCFYATHMRGGAPIHVRICMLCRKIDFDDLTAQAQAYAAPESAVPGRQTPARVRLVARRWLVGALVFGAATVPANLFGLGEVSFLLTLAGMMCMSCWSRDMGWVRGFEAGRRAERGLPDDLAD